MSLLVESSGIFYFTKNRTVKWGCWVPTRKFLFLISQHHQNGANGDVQRVCGGDISGDVCDVSCHFCP